MNRVFILGSGFSVSAGAPLSRSVLSRIFNPTVPNPQLIELRDFLNDFLFQGRKGRTEQAELEEVLSRLDLIRHYQPYPGVDYSRVTYYEEQLLGEFTKLLSPAGLSCQHPAYHQFRDLLGPDDAIISFNYDLLIEELLHSTGKRFDYHIKINDLGSPGGRYNASLSKTLPLLKLHGSINLYYCPVCAEIFFFSPLVTDHPVPYTGATVFSSDTVDTLCPNCSRLDEPVSLRHFVIAPTLFKSYTLPALRELWFRALAVLSEASELYFIGYSLPEADILSYQLFDYGRRLSRGGQKIHLINGPQLQPDRFSQIYGPAIVNEGIYFEEWVKAVRIKKA